MKKTFLNLILTFTIIVILGFSLIVVGFATSNDTAHDIVFSNADQFSNHHYHNTIRNYSTTKLDLYTDSKILCEVSYYNKSMSLLDNSMIVYGTIGMHNFTKYIDGDENTLREYPRYWHGYLAIYKPLFTFLDYNGIRVLELFFEMAMIACIVKLMFENNLKSYVIPFLLSMFLIHPEVIGMCLQFAPVFNITLISIFIMIKFKDKLFERRRLLCYFLAIGMITNYFDLLTYPLITFGIPAIFYLLLNEKTTVKKNVVSLLIFACIWSVGFAGMWLSKWIISSLILHQNIVLDGFNRFLWRSSTSNFTRIDAVVRNVFIYGKRAYLVIFAAIAIYYVKKIIPNRKNVTTDKLKNIIPFILLAITPFLWYFIASNHSYIHFWFTYRLLFILFFAVMCGIEYVLKKDDSTTSHINIKKIPDKHNNM